jgi:hypothetical protein
MNIKKTMAVGQIDENGKTCHDGGDLKITSAGGGGILQGGEKECFFFFELRRTDCL